MTNQQIDDQWQKLRAHEPFLRCPWCGYYSPYCLVPPAKRPKAMTCPKCLTVIVNEDRGVSK